MPKPLMNDMPEAAHGTPAVDLLQGKGGVGKSLIASFLAQFYKSHGAGAIGVHTDPVNPTISQYAAPGAQHLLPGSDESFIVDYGASTFIPLWHYMVKSGTASVLSEANRKLVFAQSRLDEVRSCRIF